MSAKMFAAIFTPTNGIGTTYVIDCGDYTDAFWYMKEHHPSVFATHTRRYQPGQGNSLHPSGTVLRLRVGCR